MDIPTSEIYALAGPKPWEPVSVRWHTLGGRPMAKVWFRTNREDLEGVLRATGAGDWPAFRLANGQLVIVRPRSNVIPIHGKLNSETGSVTTFDVVRPGPRGAA